MVTLIGSARDAVCGERSLLPCDSTAGSRVKFGLPTEAAAHPMIPIDLIRRLNVNDVIKKELFAVLGVYHYDHI